MVHSQVGEQKRVGGRDVIALKRGDVGFALYGPYVWLAPGRYEVDFDIAVEVDNLSDEIGVTVDVAGRYGIDVVARKRLSRADVPAEGCSVRLSFAVARQGIFEFRAFTEGTTELSIGAEPRLRALDQHGVASGTAPAAGERSKALYQDHATIFTTLETHGAVVDLGETQISFDFRGVRLNVINAEDAQLLTEIFLLNTHNMVSPRDAIVIDIGMNVGMTSLFLASKPSIRAVHGFEPFAAPYTRALQNFALNPDHASKITAHQYGLSGKDDRLDILVQSDTTIGGSVRGALSGEPESIQLKEAAAVMGPLTAHARQAGLDVIVKMDCEGSEFAILDNLVAGDLLGSITAIAIEWHKWWSVTKTQDDLIRPLLAAGFVVLDQTQLNNPHAGMLYAIRTAP